MQNSQNTFLEFSNPQIYLQRLTLRVCFTIEAPKTNIRILPILNWLHILSKNARRVLPILSNHNWKIIFIIDVCFVHLESCYVKTDTVSEIEMIKYQLTSTTENNNLLTFERKFLPVLAQRLVSVQIKSTYIYTCMGTKNWVNSFKNDL